MFAVFQGKPRLQQPSLQHQEWNLLWRVWSRQCNDILGTWWLHVLGIYLFASSYELGIGSMIPQPASVYKWSSSTKFAGSQGE